mgnify:FL=1
MRYYLLLLSLFLLPSCAVAELTAERNDGQAASKTSGVLITRSSGVPSDSLAVLSNFQSDAELMLLNQIYYKDGVLVLALSREEALELGIAEHLYDKYERDVKMANAGQDEKRQEQDSR